MFETQQGSETGQREDPRACYEQIVAFAKSLNEDVEKKTKNKAVPVGAN